MGPFVPDGALSRPPASEPRWAHNAQHRAAPRARNPRPHGTALHSRPPVPAPRPTGAPLSRSLHRTPTAPLQPPSKSAWRLPPHHRIRQALLPPDPSHLQAAPPPHPPPLSSPQAAADAAERGRGPQPGRSPQPSASQSAPRTPRENQ